MASILILRDVGLCRLLEYALLSFAVKVGDALEEHFRPYLEEGETMPSFVMALTLFGRAMKDVRKRLSEVDISRLDELDGDAEVREQLVEAMDTVRQILIDTREAVRHFYGRLALKRFGFQRETARTPDGLLEQGRRLVPNLRNPEKLKGLTSRIRGTLDLPGQATDIETALKAVEEHGGQIEFERRKADETKIRKDSMIDVFKDVFVPQARVIEGLFHLAGYRRLARRIRPAISSQSSADEVDTEGLDDLTSLVRESLDQAAAEDALEVGDSPPETTTLEDLTPEGPPEAGSVSDPDTPAVSPAG